MNSNIVTPEFDIVTVTPDLARLWLGLNTSNRKLKPVQIGSFARDMAEGRWEFNGESIKFAGTKLEPTKLLDGQNRLHGVIAANVAIQMLVVYGIEEESQGTMDSGAKRTVADQLTIRGVRNPTYIAAAANIAWREQQDAIGNRSMRPSNTTLEAFIAEHPEFEQSAEVASKYARRSDATPAMVTYSHWKFAQIDAAAATEFWMDASQKIGLRPGDPVIALTNWLADNRRQRRSWPEAVVVSVIFRAWNYRRQNRTLSVVKVQSKNGLIEIPKLAR